MTPYIAFELSHLIRLSRDEQIAKAREDARRACVDQGHALSAWRHAGVLADDEAVCACCGARLFILYGNSCLQPLMGARVFGSAYGNRCRRPDTVVVES